MTISHKINRIEKGKKITLEINKKIAGHRKIILFLSALLLMPAILGYIKTRVNYDILSYRPDSLETVKGQDIMIEEFGIGAFFMIVAEDMELKKVHRLKTEQENVEHVKMFFGMILEI